MADSRLHHASSSGYDERLPYPLEVELAFQCIERRSSAGAHVREISPAQGPPIYPQAGLIGTVERGEVLAKVLKDSAAVLLRAHGDAVVGASLEEAILRTIRLA